MELKKLLTTINNEFPEKSIDISESLGLLMGNTINGVSITSILDYSSYFPLST